MTQISKWLLYIAANKWVYFLQILNIIISGAHQNQSIPIFQNLCSTLHHRKWVLSLLFLLFIASFIIQMRFNKLKNNTRIKYPVGDDVVIEIAFSVIGQIATVLTISLDTYGILISLALFLVFGWIIVITDSLYMLPIFYLRGYHIYKSGTIKIITKMTKEQYTLKMDDSLDGISAKELVKNTFIIID